MSAEAPAEVREYRRSPAWPTLAAAALAVGALIAIALILRPPDVGPLLAGDDTVPATVTASKVELRREPSVESVVVASLEAGDRVRVGKTEGLWVAADAGSDRTGYLPADTVERETEREAREARSKTLFDFPSVFGVVASPTDVRLAPFPLAPRAGRLAKGAVVEIHSADHSYFAFRDKTHGLAFVNAADVDLVSPDPRKPPLVPEKIRALKDLTVIDLTAEPLPEAPAEEGFEPAPDALPRPAVAEAPAPGYFVPAVLARRVEPAYPERARRAGIEGIVELEVSIDASGRVTEVEVVRGLPLGVSQAAADAVSRWTYRPARTPEGPVASRKTVRVRFELRGQ